MEPLKLSGVMREVRMAPKRRYAAWYHGELLGEVEATTIDGAYETAREVYATDVAMLGDIRIFPLTDNRR